MNAISRTVRLVLAIGMAVCAHGRARADGGDGDAAIEEIVVNGETRRARPMAANASNAIYLDGTGYVVSELSALDRLDVVKGPASVAAGTAEYLCADRRAAYPRPALRCTRLHGERKCGFRSVAGPPLRPRHCCAPLCDDFQIFKISVDLAIRRGLHRVPLDLELIGRAR